MMLTEQFLKQERTAHDEMRRLDVTLEAYLVRRFGCQNVHRVHDSIVVEVDPGGNAMITVCSHCTRILTDDGTWVYMHILPDEPKTHECCPECEVEQLRELDRYEDRLATVAERRGDEC